MEIVKSTFFIVSNLMFLYQLCKFLAGKLYKLNGFQIIILGLILTINLAAVYALITDKCGIPVNIVTTGIGLLIGAVLCWNFTRKYTIRKVIWPIAEGIGILIVVAVSLYISLRLFNFQLEVTYPIKDGANHFLYAMQIVRNQSLGEYPFAPYGNAMIIEMLKPFWGVAESYKRFIVADIFYNIMENILFYGICSLILLKDRYKVLASVFTILYSMGYPYLCFSYGFVRQQRGTLLVLFLIFCLVYYERYREQEKLIVFFAVLVVINIMESYPLFLLQVGAILVLSFVGMYGKEVFFALSRKKRWIVYIFSFICICAGSVVFYFKLDAVRSRLSMEGGTYFSPYSDFIFFIPAILCMLTYAFKGCKNLKITCAVLLGGFICVIIEFVLWYYGIMSSYYYYKSYSVLWIAVWIATVVAAERLLVNDKKLIIAYAAFLCMVVCLDVSDSEFKLIQEDNLIETESIHSNYFDLYYSNITHLLKNKRDVTVSKEDMELYEYIFGYCQEDRGYFITNETDEKKGIWFSGVTGKANKVISETELDTLTTFLNRKDVENVYILKSSDIYISNEAYFQKQEVLYQNAEGVLLKKIGEVW